MPEKFFTFDQPISETTLITTAKEAIAKRMLHTPIFSASTIVKEYLIMEFADKDVEVFYVLFLNTRHNLIASEPMSFGTIDEAAVYPREILKRVLVHNAHAVILAHNHPSGSTEPSTGDKRITRKLQELLLLIDVRLLDHFVVSYDRVTCFSDRGMI